MRREIPAQDRGLTGGPERGTMNETDTQINETGTPISEAGTPLPETDAHETIRRGSVAAGEERTPKKDAAERTHPGASGDTEPTA